MFPVSADNQPDRFVTKIDIYITGFFPDVKFSLASEPYATIIQ